MTKKRTLNNTIYKIRDANDYGQIRKMEMECNKLKKKKKWDKYEKFKKKSNK